MQHQFGNLVVGRRLRPILIPSDSGSKSLAHAGMGGGGSALERDPEKLRGHRCKRDGVLCCAAFGHFDNLRGSFARRRWLPKISRDRRSPATMAVMKSTPLVTMLKERMVCGCANSYWIQCSRRFPDLEASSSFPDRRRRAWLRQACRRWPSFWLATIPADTSLAGTAIGDHRGVGIELRRRGSTRRRGERVTHADVLESSGIRWRMRQRSRERLAAFNDESRSTHTSSFPASRHPRAAGLAPARGTRDSLFHSQLIGERGRVFESVFPLRRHVRQAMVHHLRRGQGSIKVLKPAQSERDASTPDPA